MKELVLIIVLHSLTGYEVHVNPRQVTSMREPENDHKHFVEGAQCLINLADGKFVTVKETCAEVRQLIEEVVK